MSSITPALHPDGGWTIHKSFHTGAGPYLSYKISNSLRNRMVANPNITDSSISHVQWLIQRNTASIALSEDARSTSTAAGPPTPAIDWTNLPSLIESLLQMLLRPEDRRDTVTLNSNELVFVLNAHSAWPCFDMRAATDELIAQLHGKWNYRPVRVIGGLDIQRSGGHRGVSLTVLNVCNMDLHDGGGISGGMVECLEDKGVEEPRWERVVVRKSWSGNGEWLGEFVHPDLLEWVEPSGGYYRIATAVSGKKERENSAGSGTADDKGDEIEAGVGVKAKENEQEDMAKNVKGKLRNDKQEVASYDPDKKKASYDEEDEDVDAHETHPILNDDLPTYHPHNTGLDNDIDTEMEMYETVEELPDRTITSERPPIQHPTWAHSAGGPETLIDLVGRHAKRFATPDSGIGLDTTGLIDERGENKRVKTADVGAIRDEDEYEIV